MAFRLLRKWKLLAWPSLSEQEEKKIREFLKAVTLCELTASIRSRAVELRKLHHLKLPDAVVCATAMEIGVELWTNDAGLAGVPGLRCRSVGLTT
jgi:predicted nucleic acid-binding protein